MIRIWAQSGLADDSTKALALVAASGAAVSGAVAAVRGHLSTRGFAWLTAGSATLLTVYAGISVTLLARLVKEVAPYAGNGTISNGPTRAAYAVAGLAAGALLSWLALARDLAADPPMYDDLAAEYEPTHLEADAEPTDLEADAESADPAPGLDVDLVPATRWSRPPDLLGSAEEASPESGDDEDEDYDVPPLLPEGWLPTSMWSQLPMVAVALGVAAFSLLFGSSFLASTQFAQGTTAAGEATPFVAVAGLCIGLAALLPAFVHDDDVHVVTAIASTSLVAAALAVSAWQPGLAQRAAGPALVGLATGTLVPGALYLIGELRAQVSRSDLLLGSLAAVVVVAAVNVGMAYAFVPDEDLQRFLEQRERFEQSSDG